jgi:signal transduction histidine kinase
MEQFMNGILSLLNAIRTIADTDLNSEAEKRQHGFLIYMGVLMSSGGILWGLLCLAYGFYLPALVPFTYVAITVVNFTYLYLSKNFALSQHVQIFISLLLPFFFQFFLGGFVPSGGNVLWSVLAVFGSFTLQNKKMTLTWLLLFIALIIVSGLVDQQAKAYDIGASEQVTIFFFVLNFILVISVIFSLYWYFVNSEEKARDKLHQSLEELKIAQDQLIEVEKMASLGSLVSGVAHEINTPLGVGLSGVSQISHEIKELEKLYESENLTEEALQHCMQTTKELTHTIRTSLTNATTLVRSFKNISVDQHFEDTREFNLKAYMDDIIISLRGPLKSKQVTLNARVDETIELSSYPGIFSQVFSNFVLNSVSHGFDDTAENIIDITAAVSGDQLLLTYRDNGRGITDEIEKKIFDPFFTTKRGQGGSGLGLNIVYNLVTRKLGGTLKLVRVEPHGLGFDITLDYSTIKA